MPNGFTLIEILVVILIVGITLGFALLAFGDFGEKRRIIVTAEHFENYVQMVQQHAILGTSTLGITVHQNTYQVLQLSASGQWTPMSGMFRVHHIPFGVILHLRKKTTQQGMPAIIIQPSGNMTDFMLDFGSTQQAVMMTIIGDRNGTLHQVASP